MSGLVTIGVPVYKGESFLEETLQSIAGQTYEHWRAVISIDGPDSACETICERHTGDDRIDFSVRPERLGWLKNIAWLQQQATGEYWYYHQQDDLVAPTYLAELVEAAEARPEASVVYCDIETFGTRSGQFVTPSVSGSQVGRMFTFIMDQFAGVPFRGLTRVAALQATGGGIVPNTAEDFAAETVWGAWMTTWGDLIRVPKVLYRKRYHTGNVHSRWHEWADSRKSEAWVIHCHDILEAALSIPASTAEKWGLFSACMFRLADFRGSMYLRWDQFSAGDRSVLVDRLLSVISDLARVDLVGHLQAPPAEIRRRALEIVG